MNEILNEVSQKLSEVFDPGSIGGLLAQGIINLFLLIAFLLHFLPVLERHILLLAANFS